jgi:hypothetical protein
LASVTSTAPDDNPKALSHQPVESQPSQLELVSATPDSSLWAAVDRLLERTEEVERIRAHKLGALAALRLERLRLDVPLPLLHDQRAARISMLTAPAVLARARAAYDGPIVVFKGPEVATCYPGAARQFGDLDLLVPDSHAAQRALLAAGFVEEDDPGGKYVGIHHLPPLRWPNMLLTIEVHHGPKWPDGLRVPRNEEIFEAAVPTSLGIDGVQAPAPEHHALLIAAHGWAHVPLSQLRDVVDVASVAAGLDDAELSRLARAWGLSRVWESTRAAAECLETGKRSFALSVWARHLATMRERTVLENHIESWLSPFSTLPFAAALGATARSVVEDFRPALDESWGEKLGRTVRAAGNAFVARSEHDRELGESAERLRRRNRRAAG